VQEEIWCLSVVDGQNGWFNCQSEQIGYNVCFYLRNGPFPHFTKKRVSLQEFNNEKINTASLDYLLHPSSAMEQTEWHSHYN
jgi:hypothetical protein